MNDRRRGALIGLAVAERLDQTEAVFRGMCAHV
jgi:hypothetical protein